MTVVAMIKFGRTLTDREYGKSIAAALAQAGPLPWVLDFRGVISLGSSCGDEILSAVAAKQNSQVQTMNANQAVRSCLEKVAEDLKVTISFTD